MMPFPLQYYFCVLKDLGTSLQPPCLFIGVLL